MTDEKRLGPPPVEPMSEAAWSRVERGVWAELDAAGPARVAAAPAARRWWLVAAPVAAAAVAIVIAARPSAEVGRSEPSRVVSGSAPSSVTFGDAHIELDADTALEMAAASGQPTVQLERGAARFTVAPRMRRPAFVVRAGDATVRVVGTQFRVARSEERITVEVDRGLVDVQFRGDVVAVAANQRWSSEAPGQISTLARAEPGVQPDPVPGAAVERPAASPEVAAGETGARPEAPADAIRGAKPGPRPGARSDAGAAITTTAPPEPAAQVARDAERVEYERLAALEPRRPEAALSGYLALARGTSRWADLSLYAAARLAADRRDPRAQTLLGIYLQRFPDGANAADARTLLAHLKGERP